MVVFAISAVKTRQMIPSVRDGGEFVVNPITKVVGSRKGFYSLAKYLGLASSSNIFLTLKRVCLVAKRVVMLASGQNYWKHTMELLFCDVYSLKRRWR